MSPTSRAFFIASATVLAFDTLASLVTLLASIDYAWLSPISYLIYASGGFMVGRVSGGLKAAAVVGAGVAGVDATIGWAISWILGPGQPPPEARGLAILLTAAIVVVLTGMVAGMLGGAVGRRLSARTAA